MKMGGGLEKRNAGIRSKEGGKVREYGRDEKERKIKRKTGQNWR
jgi:hypothetical protein